MTTSRNYGRSSNRHNHLHSHEHNFHGLRMYYYQRCDALSFECLKRRLKIKNRIVPYLFLLMFNFWCKGMIRLCSLSAQSKECAKMKEKKQKELILPALIICLTYYNCLNVSTKNASFAFIFSQKSA